MNFISYVYIQNIQNMERSIIDRVLHLIINDSKRCQNELKLIQEIASSYEGEIVNRIGFNFPFNTIDLKKYKLFLPYVSQVDYVIVYKKGDVQTKKHELLHAKYAMDESYRKKIKQLWDTFTLSFQENILKMLKKMKYPESVFLDEFQAYYFSEQPNFFGKTKLI